MQQLHKLVLLAAVVTAAVIATNLVSNQPIAAQGSSKDVIVQNTTGNPVPTSAQGTTAVSGTVSASQNGTWSVGVHNDNSEPFQVNSANTPLPFDLTLPSSMTGGTPTTVAIEFVSAGCMAPVGTTATGNMSIRTSIGGATSQHFLIPVLTGSFNNGVSITISERTSIYAIPGTSVNFGSTFLSNSTSCVLTLSGRLIK